MSDFIKMKCCNCNNTIELYHETIVHREQPMLCPFCYEEIDASGWNRLVDAFLSVSDWNYQSLKEHNEHKTGRFTIEVVHKDVASDKIRL